MIGSRVERALQIASGEGIENALGWLAVHVWFASAIDDRAKILRPITS